MLREFGISPASARAALSRLVKRGRIAMRGDTRPPVYQLTAAGDRPAPLPDAALPDLRGPPAAVDRGLGAGVSFSIPSSGQASRHAVRRALTAHGFVGLYDSVWIRPGVHAGPVRAELESLLHPVEGARWSVLHVRFDEEAGPHGPAAAYDLTGLAAGYRRSSPGTRRCGWPPAGRGRPGHRAGGAYLRSWTPGAGSPTPTRICPRTCCRSPGPDSGPGRPSWTSTPALGAARPDPADRGDHPALAGRRHLDHPLPRLDGTPRAGTDRRRAARTSHPARQAGNTLTLFVTPVIVTAYR